MAHWIKGGQGSAKSGVDIRSISISFLLNAKGKVSNSRMIFSGVWDCSDFPQHSRQNPMNSWFLGVFMFPPLKI
jgi:hypothetical protein